MGGACMEKLARPTPLRGNINLDWFPKDGLYAEMYNEATSEGLTFTGYLEKLKSARMGHPSPYYGLSNSEILIKRKAFSDRGEQPPMTALEELLFHAGVKISGPHADYAKKLFDYSDVDVLVPEVISFKIYEGLLLDSLVPIFAPTQIVLTEGMSYKKIYANESETDRQTQIVAPGAELGETHVSFAKREVHMQKYGLYLTIQNEVLMWSKLNVLGIMFNRIGKQIQIDETDEMFSVIQNGDGNPDTTPYTTVETAVSGTIAVQDVIAWAMAGEAPYRIDVFAGQKELLKKYFATIAGMNNSFSAYSNDIGIKLPKAYEWNRNIIGSTNFIGVDSKYAVEHLTNGEVKTESEKIIRRWIQGTAIVYWSGFSIIDNRATAIFAETHS